MTRRLLAEWPLVAIALCLSMFGIAMVYSAGQTDVQTFVAEMWKRQLAWLVVAFVGAFIMSRASVRLIEWMTLPAYVLSLVLLVVLLVGGGGGAGTAASTKSWLVLGGLRIGQPSELAKITVVLMLAQVLSARREPARSLLERPAVSCVGETS